MAKNKPVCPNCGAKAFQIRQTFAVKGTCHELECKRFAYYKCAQCGCECLLTTPQGQLEILEKGKITQELAERVLQALNLSPELAKKLK